MSDPDIHIRWLAGFCPVQAEGTINGQEFYFRARGNHWSLRIGGDDPVGNPAWSYEEPYGDEPFAAGWMPFDEAWEFIHKAAREFTIDQEIARIENLSEAELDAELRLLGVIPEKIAAEGRDMVATFFWYDPRLPRMLKAGTAD